MPAGASAATSRTTRSARSTVQVGCPTWSATTSSEPRSAATRALFDAGPTARMLAETSPDNLASLHGFFARAPLAVTAALLTRIGGDGPGILPRDAAAIAVPTLVIGSARDAIHPLALARATADAIPGAEMVEIPDKTTDRAAYRAGFSAALRGFLAAL